MAEPQQHRDDRKSVAAILAYICLAQLTLFTTLIFVVIFLRIPVEAVMLGVLGTLLASLTGNAGLALGYHLASSAGATTANAALAQKAGAGPPAPAIPMTEPAVAGEGDDR